MEAVQAQPFLFLPVTFARSSLTMPLTMASCSGVRLLMTSLCGLSCEKQTSTVDQRCRVVRARARARVRVRVRARVRVRVYG